MDARGSRTACWSEALIVARSRDGARETIDEMVFNDPS